MPPKRASTSSATMSSSREQRARSAHIVYGIFFLVGLGSSLPWNVFITAQQYFQQRLEDTDYEESFLNWFSMGFNISTLLSMLVRTLCFGERMPSAANTVFFSLMVTMVIIFGHCLLTRMPEYSGACGINIMSVAGASVAVLTAILCVCMPSCV